MGASIVGRVAVAAACLALVAPNGASATQVPTAVRHTGAWLVTHPLHTRSAAEDQLIVKYVNSTIRGSWLAGPVTISERDTADYGGGPIETRGLLRYDGTTGVASHDGTTYLYFNHRFVYQREEGTWYRYRFGSASARNILFGVPLPPTTRVFLGSRSRSGVFSWILTDPARGSQPENNYDLIFGPRGRLALLVRELAGNTTFETGYNYSKQRRKVHIPPSVVKAAHPIP